MKTKLTKSILFLSLIISLLFPVSSFAAQNQVNDTISHVEYDPNCGVYYAVTNESDSGSWILYVMSSENENKSILEGLNAILKDKKISILYENHGMEYDYWEVLDWTILE